MNKSLIESMIIEKLREANKPIALIDIFDEITPLHFEVIRYLIEDSEIVESVYPFKYQLR